MSGYNQEKYNLQVAQRWLAALTDKALEAESRYIKAVDDPATTRVELDYYLWEYRLALTVLGRAINERVSQVNNVKESGKKQYTAKQHRVKGRVAA